MSLASCTEAFPKPNMSFHTDPSNQGINLLGKKQTHSHQETERHGAIYLSSFNEMLNTFNSQNGFFEVDFIQSFLVDHYIKVTKPQNITNFQVKIQVTKIRLMCNH